MDKELREMDEEYRAAVTISVKSDMDRDNLMGYLKSRVMKSLKVWDFGNIEFSITIERYDEEDDVAVLEDTYIGEVNN